MPDNVDLDTVTVSGMYRLAAMELPWQAFSQMLVVHGGADTISQVIFAFGGGSVYVRTGNPTQVGGPGVWGDWKQLAVCAAPEVHELPLASGFPAQSYANTYYKTQEGIVHLNFCITRGSSTAFTASEVVCTLPIGYRPSSVRMFSVGGDSGYFSTVAAPVQVYVTSDGELKFISCAQKVTWIYGEITYLAG